MPGTKVSFFGLCQWIAILVTASLHVTCQNADTNFDSFFSKAHQRGFNGNVLIAEKGEVIYSGAHGLSNYLTQDFLNLESAFRLASVSKQFTAMAIMILQDKGQLKFDQDIRDFIPVLPYTGITVRHLLNHTSGLPDYVVLLDEYWKPEYQIDDPRRLISGNKDIIDLLVSKNPEVHFKPGEKFEYSNTGYVLLATIVARVSGIPFEEFVANEIFTPAQMLKTIVYDYVEDFDPHFPNRVFGFSSDTDGWVSNDCHYLNKAQGDGGIYSTVGDLLKWDRILYSNKLVSSETLAEAYHPAALNNGQSTDYGFGLFIDTATDGGRVVQHGGGWLGFRTHVYRDLDREICIVLLTNNSSEHLGSILRSVLRMAYR